MSAPRWQFTAFSRLLHWTMAAMVLTMLCIGVAMVASLARYHVLVSIHRPLGIAILILVVVRFVNRRLTRRRLFPRPCLRGVGAPPHRNSRCMARCPSRWSAGMLSPRTPGLFGSVHRRILRRAG
jgi:hypothetical protein